MAMLPPRKGCKRKAHRLALNAHAAPHDPEPGNDLEKHLVPWPFNHPLLPDFPHLCQNQFGMASKQKVAKVEYIQTPKEELANSLTHGFALLLSIVGLVNLVIQASLHGTAIHLVTVNIFCASMIFLFASSTVYHAVFHPKLKHVCRIVDHSNIYILIAGTYTPVTLLVLPGAWGWSLFGVVWGLALVGVVFKLFFTGRFDKVSTGIYLGMGWLAIVAAKPMWDNMQPGGLALMVAGGLAYSIGVIFYRWDKLPFHHAVWHVFVFLGAACHFFMIALYCVPGITFTA
jgi:hemolysin III